MVEAQVSLTTADGVTRGELWRLVTTVTDWLWGSLATLLWRERCAACGVRVSAREFAAVGVIGVPLLQASATAGLLLTA